MLFDNDINMDYDVTFLDLANINRPNDKSRNILSAKEGFLRGNMFRDEYKPYKNLTYLNISPKNEREAALFNVMCYSFAINDLNLYLDIHNDDMMAFNLLKELIKEEYSAKKEYVEKYGPLDICDNTKSKFEWTESPWPWENMGGNIYV